MMMGGSGTRMGAKIPKQYIMIGNKPVFYYIVRKYAQLEFIDRICIVSHRDYVSYVEEVTADIPEASKIIVTCGGENRSQSVRNGLQAAEKGSSDQDVVLIHDATHPYVDPEGILKVIDAVHRVGGATMAAHLYDTCYRIDYENRLMNVIPREEIVSGASPEAFTYGDLKKIYYSADDRELAGMTSAGAIALAHHIPMEVIPTRIMNLKLTYPEDIELFKLLIDSYFFKED